MSKKKKSKPGWRSHSDNRMWLRYNRELAEKDYAAIAQLIQKEKGTHVATQSCRVRVWDVPYMGHMLRVVYDRYRKQAITILTPDMGVKDILITIVCKGCGRAARLRPTKLAVCDGYYCGRCDFFPPDQAILVDCAAGDLTGYGLSENTQTR